ncbi:MAG TPA: SIR2 family protein [Candidatus Thermoplasmatota archaeon]|jgi:NAD-dependent SIR2 family protein deacetylase|nr:SIR2 family protein [Candidatus Thermoplasmatota archaeon]
MGRSNAVVVLGAGFSKPLGGPLLGELLSEPYLDSSRASADALQWMTATLAERRLSQPNFSIEDLFTEVWRDARTGEKVAEAALRELTIHLASVCTALRPKTQRKSFAQYVDFFAALHANHDRLTIVSFNYDLVLEAALDRADILYDYGNAPDLFFDDNARRRKLNRRGADVQILKLHGSANWGVCRGCKKADKSDDQVIAYEDGYVPWRRRACPLCNERYLESGIIPPVFGKAGETRHVRDAWRQAREQLRYAHHVLVVGYSLPPSDHEARSLLRETQQSKNRMQVDIVCGERGGSAEYAHVFPGVQDWQCRFEDYLQALNGEA